MKNRPVSSSAPGDRSETFSIVERWPFLIVSAFCALLALAGTGCTPETVESTPPETPPEAQAPAAVDSAAPSEQKDATSANEATASKVASLPVAHEASDLPADSTVTWGVLENGLRYAIMPNAEPPNRVSLRLFVDAGSLMEEEDQRGLAHFLEHMAFNGTKNFPAGEMIEYFQRLGMAFGSHTNAHTSFRETVYKLEMPNAEPELLDEGFLLLRDYADGMLLEDAEIEKERGVILSEKRSRDSVGWRTFVDQIAFSLPESLVSSRLPIGEEEVISGAPRERFEHFYRTWYTADRMVLLAVGNVEVEAIEALVKKHFSDLPAGTGEAPDLDLGKVTERGLVAHFHPEPEAGQVDVSIEGLRPPLDLPDSKARRAHELRLGLANAIIGRRLGILAKEADSKIISGTAHYYDLFDLGFAQYASIGVSSKPENWKEALQVAEQELRRAIEHGFTEAELKEAKANILNAYEKAEASMATRKSRELADAIADRLGSRRVFTSPKDDLARVTDELEKVTAEECQALLADYWTDLPETQVMVSGKVEIPEAEETILAAFDESRAIAVEPPAQVEEKAFAYGELPEAGGIASQETIEDLEVTQLVLENGVRINLKATEFEADTISLKMRIGGGGLTQPADKPGLGFFASGVYSNGGLEAHDIDEIRRLFAGKSVGVNFSVAEDAFEFFGRTTPKDLRDQLLLMRAYLISPGFREEAQTQLRRQYDALYQQLSSTPQGIMQDSVDRFLHSDDARFGLPAREELEKRNLEEVKAWLREPLEKAYMEVTAVGDFKIETVVEALSEVFGSLPPRESEKPPFTEERKVAFPRGAGEKTFPFTSEIPKGMALVYWPTTDIWDIRRTRRIGMLGSVFDDRLRLKIREELGDAYSPFAHNLPSDVYTDYGFMFGSVTVAPEQAAEVAAVVREIGKELSSGDAITQDELDRAKQPQITQIEEFRRSNRYWMSSVLESSQEFPQRLDWSRSFVDDYKAITLEEINAVAKEFLKESESVTVLILPEPAAGAEAEAEDAAPEDDAE